MAGGRLLRFAAVFTMALACLSIGGCKGEDEHPTEHPSQEGQATGLTYDQLADAIEAYVQKEAAAHEGYFPIADEKTGEQLRLTLVKVHRERLAKVGENNYFACVDFKTPEGKLYDVDFFMKGPSVSNLMFSEFMIHKEEGKERYTWYEEGGIWKRTSLEAAGQPAAGPNEHPTEHPTEHPQ